MLMGRNYKFMLFFLLLRLIIDNSIMIVSKTYNRMRHTHIVGLRQHSSYVILSQRILCWPGRYVANLLHYENSSANKLHLKPTAPLYYTFRGFSRMDCYKVRNSTKYVMHIFAFFHFIRILVSVEEKREELSSIMVTFQHCVKCIQ